MPEKRSFWSTLPGLITGIAAIVTGLVALIPILAGGHHSTSSSRGSAPPASATPTPTASGGGTPSVTDSSGTGDTPGTPGTPGTSDTPGAAGSTGAPAVAGSPGSPALLTANPPSLDFKSVVLGQSSPAHTVTITNAGGKPATITSTIPDGSSASWFSIQSTTCGSGAALPPGQTCRVEVQATAQSVQQAAASLVVSYQADAPTTLSIPLSATGSILP